MGDITTATTASYPLSKHDRVAAEVTVQIFSLRIHRPDLREPGSSTFLVIDVGRERCATRETRWRGKNEEPINEQCVLKVRRDAETVVLKLKTKGGGLMTDPTIASSNIPMARLGSVKPFRKWSPLLATDASVVGEVCHCSWVSAWREPSQCDSPTSPLSPKLLPSRLTRTNSGSDSDQPPSPGVSPRGFFNEPPLSQNSIRRAKSGGTSEKPPLPSPLGKSKSLSALKRTEENFDCEPSYEPPPTSPNSGPGTPQSAKLRLKKLAMGLGMGSTEELQSLGEECKDKQNLTSQPLDSILHATPPITQGLEDYNGGFFRSQSNMGSEDVSQDTWGRVSKLGSPVPKSGGEAATDQITITTGSPGSKSKTRPPIQIPKDMSENTSDQSEKGTHTTAASPLLSPAPIGRRSPFSPSSSNDDLQSYSTAGTISGGNSPKSPRKQPKRPASPLALLKALGRKISGEPQGSVGGQNPKNEFEKYGNSSAADMFAMLSEWVGEEGLRQAIDGLDSRAQTEVLTKLYVAHLIGRMSQMEANYKMAASRRHTQILAAARLRRRASQLCAFAQNTATTNSELRDAVCVPILQSAGMQTQLSNIIGPLELDLKQGSKQALNSEKHKGSDVSHNVHTRQSSNQSKLGISEFFSRYWSKNDDSDDGSDEGTRKLARLATGLTNARTGQCDYWRRVEECKRQLDPFLARTFEHHMMVMGSLLEAVEMERMILNLSAASDWLAVEHEMLERAVLVAERRIREDGLWNDWLCFSEGDIKQ